MKAESSDELRSLYLGLLGSYLLLVMHVFLNIVFDGQGVRGFYLPFNMLGWIFISVLIGVGLWQIARSRQLVMSPLLVGSWVGFLLLLVPLFYPNSEFREQAIPRFFCIAGGLLFYFSLLQWRFDAATRISLMYLILGAVLVEVGLGVMQYFVLGEDNWMMYDTRLNRPYGIFQMPNVLSSFLATGLALALYLLRWDTASVQIRWRQAMIAVALLGIPLLLVVILSRAGQVGALLASALLLPVLWRHERRVAVWAGVAILISLVAGLLCLMFVHMGRNPETYQLTTSSRLLYWTHVLEMIRETPWLGIGYRGFETHFVHHYYDIARLRPGMPFIEQGLDHPHNELLFWTIEGGVVAALGLLVAAGIYLRQLCRVPAWSKRISLLAMLLPILFHTLVELPLYYSLAHGIVFLILVWLVDEESSMVREHAFTHGWLPRTLAVIIPLLVIPFMGTGLQTAWLVTQYEREGQRSPELLQQVTNPLPWKLLVEYYQYSHRLQVARQTNNRMELEAYVDWVTGLIAYRPRLYFFHQLAAVLRELGRESQARYWETEARRLFPDPVLLRRDFSPWLKVEHQETNIAMTSH